MLLGWSFAEIIAWLPGYLLLICIGQIIRGD